ncbi:hypothetical protein BJX63DRAFT_414656 [Aspergillus granulosus]|uniref:Uncharacterized protein n=1 Tax=Aspergillus granulosus TaxID=176169 RepID=A0ABR4GU66_9EURO
MHGRPLVLEQQLREKPKRGADLSPKAVAFGGEQRLRHRSRFTTQESLRDLAAAPAPGRWTLLPNTETT